MLDDVFLPNGRFIPVISEFRYLGSYMTRDGTDTKDVRARINSAARAFGALSKCIFQSKHVKRDAKRAVYERLILSICLYGCESARVGASKKLFIKSCANFTLAV